MNNRNTGNATGAEADDNSSTKVDIQPSDAGQDPEVGHTPGKAEGVEDAEDEGNQ